MPKALMEVEAVNNNSTMVKNRVFRKLANIAYLIETVNKGAKLQIVLEYDGNFYYRVQVIEEDGIETFLMYLNESVYASVQSLLGCSEGKNSTSLILCIRWSIGICLP